MKKALWLIVIVLLPNLILFFAHELGNIISLSVYSFIYLYVITTIFIILIVWLRPCNLYTLPLSFNITPLFDLIWIWSLKWEYMDSSNKIFGFILLIVIYAFPFSLITWIIATVAAKKSQDKGRTAG